MNRSVFVTGATNGTGYAIASRFAKEGYDVFITSRTKENADEAAAKLQREYPGIKAFGVGLEVCGEERIKEVFGDIRGKGYLLDTIVFNAANLGIKQLTLEVDIKDFIDVFYTNITWNFMMARQAALMMKEKGKGSIVFINSNTAYRAIPDRVAYSASKSGVLGMSRALAVDFGKYGIRCNCVLPGMIKTERWVNNYNDCRNAMSNYTPIGDIAEFEDVANAAWYFGSDESRNTTGAELIVDGGNAIQLYPVNMPKK
ncbi:MAG: SDR family oxidoreductase [Spirochaetes bacterium]|nr:SDR family oxidoreductase [Spirochaetota bacterium]